ncbi:MAG: cytochrome ubiquinol oxidase subunit I [Puniceicoccales bacterium]|jgi:cytochrome d ubiquinol oxidase subunit I|nr:cytochrome ubiquinol oxidase subunit I [Puniceicoccales bacterium]
MLNALANVTAASADAVAPLAPTLVDWSRAQFALTAMFHWCFVPLTLGLGVIMAVMETLYVKTGDPKWRRTTRFWQKIFGINFAIGVATGIILEFEFGTNWSNYSWLVGDIFGAPLAIEGILAFFMEATFISIMFFGWDKVGKKAHLASTWLTTAGATFSALWILVANAWMQNPVGWRFNPDTMRTEMTDFWAVALSPFAINKFLHTVTSSWMLGAAVVVGIASWYLLKNREKVFALDSVRVAAAVGFAGLLLTLYTGDKSAYQVAGAQPMKFAAMEGLYDGGTGVEITAVGILNAEKKYDDTQKPMLWDVALPKVLSLLATHSLDGHVPGVSDIVRGGYKDKDGVTTLSVSEKMALGKAVRRALGEYTATSKALREAQKRGDTAAVATATAHLEAQRKTLDAHFKYFGYGFFDSPADAIPHVPLTFYSFRVMVIIGVYYFALFPLLCWLVKTGRFAKMRGLQRLCVCSVPLAYICSQAGWIVAEVGRQPWAIQDILPLGAAVSNLDPTNVKVTFFIFLALFSVLLAAELRILSKQIQAGPEPLSGGLDPCDAGLGGH